MSDLFSPDTVVSTYMEAFARCDAAAVRALLSEEVVLQDPFAGRVCGIDSVMEINQGLFKGNRLEMELRRKFVSGNTVAQEFALRIVSDAGAVTRVEGIDLIEVRDGLIADIRAYVEAAPEGSQ